MSSEFRAFIMQSTLGNPPGLINIKYSASLLGKQSAMNNNNNNNNDDDNNNNTIHRWPSVLFSHPIEGHIESNEDFVLSKDRLLQNESLVLS